MRKRKGWGREDLQKRIEVVVKGTRGNEGAERSGAHDKEEWTKDRVLGDTTGGCVPGRQVSYTFDTEGTR